MFMDIKSSQSKLAVDYRGRSIIFIHQAMVAGCLCFLVHMVGGSKLVFFILALINSFPSSSAWQLHSCQGFMACIVFAFVMVYIIVCCHAIF